MPGEESGRRPDAACKALWLATARISRCGAGSHRLRCEGAEGAGRNQGSRRLQAPKLGAVAPEPGSAGGENQ